MKTISVLLTKYSDCISCLLHHIAGHGYTHASLGLDGGDTQYYSFNYKGFCIETLEKHRRRGVSKSICYELQVPEEVYDNLKRRIEIFKQNREDFHYTRLGVLFAVLHIPFHWQKHYICSQFVAELLVNSGAVSLQGNTGAYLPNQFQKELVQSERLAQITYDLL